MLPLYFQQIGRKPLHPTLWYSCTHAYSLSAYGLTGTSLFNLASPIMRGTLENMDPSVNLITDNGYAIKPTASGNRITLGSYNQKFSAFTLSAWIKFLSFSANPFGWSRIFDWGVFSGDDDDGIIISQSSTTSSLRVFAHGVGPTISNFFEIDSWIHCVVTINTSGTIKTFKNGILLSSGSYTPLSYSSYPSCRIAASNHYTDHSNNYLSAVIDSYQIWDREITDQEVALLASNRSIAYESQPIFPIVFQYTIIPFEENLLSETNLNLNLNQFNQIDYQINKSSITLITFGGISQIDYQENLNDNQQQNILYIPKNNSLPPFPKIKFKVKLNLNYTDLNISQKFTNLKEGSEFTLYGKEAIYFRNNFVYGYATPGNEFLIIID